MVSSTLSLVTTLRPSASGVRLSTTSSKVFNNLLASPPLARNKASVSSNATALAAMCSSSFKARVIRPWSTSAESGSSTYVWQRLRKAGMTSNEGFSVVAPSSVTVPASTAPSKLSCWDFENRWISSMNNNARPANMPSRFTESKTLRTSLTPLWIALKLWNGLPDSWAISRASVVLPTPGGPHKIMLGSVPARMA